MVRQRLGAFRTKKKMGNFLKKMDEGKTPAVSFHSSEEISAFSEHGRDFKRVLALKKQRRKI